MPTIQEFEIRLKANLMKQKFVPNVQWRVINDVRDVVKETIQEMGLEPYLLVSSVHSSITIHPSFNYGKDVLGIEENIARKLSYSWDNDGLFRIKVTKAKDKNKSKTSGRQLFKLKAAEIVLDDKTITFDDLTLQRAKERAEADKEEDRLRNKQNEEKKQKYEDFIRNVLLSKGLTIQEFEDIHNQFHNLPWLLYEDRQEIHKKFAKESS